MMAAPSSPNLTLHLVVVGVGGDAGKNSSLLETAVAAAAATGEVPTDPMTKKPVTQPRQQQAIRAKKRKSEGGKIMMVVVDRGGEARPGGCSGREERSDIHTRNHCQTHR